MNKKEEIKDSLNFLYGCLAWALVGSDVHTTIMQKIANLEERLFAYGDARDLNEED
jgi:hypothetical protein